LRARQIGDIGERIRARPDRVLSRRDSEVDGDAGGSVLIACGVTSADGARQGVVARTTLQNTGAAAGQMVVKTRSAKSLDVC
jgi:hypothetical protein